MKKRIAAAALAAVLVCGIIGLRPKAAGLASAGVALGVLAFNLLGVMSGQYDDVAEGIGCFVESGVEGWQKAFVGSENTPSWFVSGWQQIYDTCAGWFNSGEITISADGKVDLTYDQYMQLYHQMIKSVGKPSLEFESAYKCGFFSADLSQPILVGDLPQSSDLFATSGGQSFAPVYYNDEKIVFADYFTWISQVKLDNGFYNSSWYVFYVDSGFERRRLLYRGGGCAFADIVKEAPTLYMPDLSMLQYSYLSNGNQQLAKRDSTKCFVYDGISVTYTDIAEVDISGMSSGLVTTIGDFQLFLKSIQGYSSTVTAPLDDLSDVLPLDKTKNPTLEVDTDPSIVNPDDTITVKDVPGNPDMTLTEYKAQLKLDIDIPSIISTKFPFCIPYDLIRILGVFVADPVAPVFRIPISTDPAQLEPFKGNQTIGNIPEDFEPMFEIDEELVIDLSVVPLVQPICYTVFIVGFIVLLIHITPKMINH